MDNGVSCTAFLMLFIFVFGVAVGRTLPRRQTMYGHVQTAYPTKTELIPGPQVVELWHDGKIIGEVAGADGPGVRVISKHPLAPCHKPGFPEVVEVTIVMPEYVATKTRRRSG